MYRRKSSRLVRNCDGRSCGEHQSLLVERVGCRRRRRGIRLSTIGDRPETAKERTTTGGHRPPLQLAARQRGPTNGRQRPAVPSTALRAGADPDRCVGVDRSYRKCNGGKRQRSPASRRDPAWGGTSTPLRSAQDDTFRCRRSSFRLAPTREFRLLCLHAEDVRERRVDAENWRGA